MIETPEFPGSCARAFARRQRAYAGAGHLLWPTNPGKCVRILLAAFLAMLCSNGITWAQNGTARNQDSAVLELRLPPTPQPNYGAAVPQQIAGHVRVVNNGLTRPARDVSVTDGYSVVKTDAQGGYAITPSPNAVFIYITRPSGHDVVGDWYKPLAASVDFTLKPAAESEEEFVFVHLTDAHISNNPRSLLGLSAFVRELNAMQPRPRFVVNSGDLLDLHKALISRPASGHVSFRNFVGIMNHLEMPCYNVAGDHTDSSYRLDQFPRGDHRCGKPMYWEYLGPHFYSFEYGAIHFVSVDFGYHLGQRQIVVNGKELEYPTNQVQPMHVKWLRQDMANRSQGRFVITTSEFDLEKHCPNFLKLAKQHDVRMQLVGDIHVVTSKARTVPYSVGGALAGCWWNPRTHQLCPDLSPQGYMIYHVQGDRWESFYKGLGQRIAIVSHRIGAAWRGAVTLQAHLVQPQPGDSLEYSLNGTDWTPMQEIGRPFYRALYQTTVQTAELADGLRTISIRNPADDEVRSQTIVVANGSGSGKYTADASLTFTVATPTQWTTARAPSGKTEVLINDQVIGRLEPGLHKTYTFRVPSKTLRDVNLLTFRFETADDGMNLTSPALTYGKTTHRDPRDKAIREIKAAHWGPAAIDWGGYIAGNATPPDETPFDRRQNVFCLILNSQE
ncbi:MAG: metallophosphoesterase N-terminal domain-containing protein [Planctomycetaceae bacterium]